MFLRNVFQTSTTPRAPVTNIQGATAARAARMRAAASSIFATSRAAQATSGGTSEGQESFYVGEDNSKSFVVTVGEVYITARVLAKALVAMNVKHGDAIGLIGPNSVDWFTVELAVVFAG
jgi:long-subunit acyl-CoA synthetase (AMP-forming)